MSLNSDTASRMVEVVVGPCSNGFSLGFHPATKPINPEFHFDMNPRDTGLQVACGQNFHIKMAKSGALISATLLQYM